MAQQNDSKVAESDAQAASDAVTTSSGPDPPDKDAIGDLNVYGTRSRNRGGNARPNYAEDKDIDIDMYDFYHDKKDGDGSKKSSRQASVNGSGEATRANAASRKSGAADDAKAAPPQNGHRDQNLGGGTSAQQATQAPTASQPSRKRKAAATAATSSATASAKKGSSAAQQSATSWPETNMLTFDNCNSRLAHGKMVADDGTVLEANDNVYLVCEPPGEPYYLGRIMEFLHQKSDDSRPVDAVRINWFYRPKDIGRKVTDTRLVFATMHSDISPLTALRGKCQIRHKVEISNMDDFRKTPDSFWYEKLYDRYIQKNYDLIPTGAIINVPDKVKKVLDERWKFVLVEQGRGKELTSAVKSCKRCHNYCASHDSVDCAVCRFTYHMYCVKPPLQKKPSRGFAWSCAACSRAQERKLEARLTSSTSEFNDDEEFFDEDDEDVQGIETDRTSPADDEKHHEGTTEQIYHASLWPYRYLGMHCKSEDALDYDDRIYPRASTRIGPKHQATVGTWPGQPVEYVKPLEIKRGGKKDSKMSKEAQAAQEAEKARRGNRPKWVQDQPVGYVARGEDFEEGDPNSTATLLWKPLPADTISSKETNAYMTDALGLVKKLNVPKLSTNLQDAAVETLFRNVGDTCSALKDLSEIDRKLLKEPNPSATEQKKFEEGVAKYGSELYLVKRHVKALTPGQIVRYYYTWKKTERGQQVWGNFPGRKGKKQAKRAEAAANKFSDEVADNDDDSAFDTGKAAEKKRGFVCQFCSTTSSRQWRRAPNATAELVDENGTKTGSKDKNGQYVVALCRRCAELWRRYAIRWEDMDEMAKKVAQSGGKAWKRKQDEELLKELQVAQELGLMTPERAVTPVGTPVASQEPPRKKLKGAPAEKGSEKGSEKTSGKASEKTSSKVSEKTSGKDTEAVNLIGTNSSSASKKKEKAAETTPIPEMPKPRTLPCAVCGDLEPLGDQHLSCRECRLTIHRHCYGVVDSRIQGKWICEMCANDKSPQVSIQYKCVLCPIEHTEQDFIEQPKLTHHKKKMSEKDRERERVEVQQARKAAEQYRKKQEELGRPLNPREPLKRTADNNWVHVTCAIWTPEVKFANAKALEPSEGIPSIPRAKYDEVCQACNRQGGACVPCHQCRVPYHVECARQHGHVLGFDMTPVKSSRRDQFNIVTVNGENGTMSAVIWCKDHVPTKTVVHRMQDMVAEAGLNTLQFYVQNFKQADLALTGTVRKANLMAAAAKLSGATPTQLTMRRASTTTVPNGNWHTIRNSETVHAASNAQHPGEKVCITCGIDVSPKWWPIDISQERRLTNGHYGSIGSEAQKFVEQRKYQCHKCRKLARTPKAHLMRPSPTPPEAPPRHYQPEPSVSAIAPPLRSPPALPPPPSPIHDYRDGRVSEHGWPQHPGTHAPVPPPVQAPGHQSHMMGQSRVAAPAAHSYPAPTPPPRAPGYGDWGPPPPLQPSNQHGSPPRHLNGGPPISGLSSLRPPSMSGPPPGPPIPVGHQHPHSSTPYVNGLPLSPRRVNGPTPPSPYVSSYHNGPGQPTAPLGHSLPPGVAHNVPHGLSNGGPPPPAPPPPPSRQDAFPSHHPHGHHGHRSPYLGPHGSPPISRNGMAPPHDIPPPAPAGPAPPRGPDGRPASGASASPSLRNLLS